MLPPQSLNDLKRIIHHHSRHPYSLSSSSTNFSLDSPSPSTRPRSPYISSRQLQPASPVPLSTAHSKSLSHSIASQTIEGVLAPGDIVGDGFLLQGKSIRLVSNGATTYGHRVPAQEFEVIKQLGSGSYAVVYLVQEVLFRPPPSEDGHMSTIGLMELDTNKSPSAPHIVYGREYAIKCLSKANLDEDALALQMDEVNNPFSQLFLIFLTFITSGYHSSVTSFASQYCHSSPHPSNFRLFASSSRIRPRRGSLLLFGTGPGSS